MVRPRFLAVLGLLLATPGFAAGPDNFVDRSGISHLPQEDRRPLCPVGGESFAVRFQALQGDLTAARVQVNDGTVAWVDAAVVEGRGPYDVWSAPIPATAAGALSYVIELTDGTDTDYLSVGGFTDTFPTDGGFPLDFTTLSHAPFGATPVSGGGTVFKVWAPTRTTVHVRGDFNGWSTANPLTKVGTDFVGLVPGAVPGQEYKFFFNNTVWNVDARARALDPSNNNNSIIEDPFGYAWQSGPFATPPPEELVIYQLHVGTFAGRNDPAGAAPFPSRYVDVAARVQHLVDLGVNAVMLNPITEFPGDLSAGYNPITQWAPEWIYGTPDDFKFMVDTFHANGIAVILDIVWNHFTVNDNFLWNYDGTQIYFDTPNVDTPWGAQANFDAAEVADYFVESADYWLEEFRLDGFRMDATDFMTVFPQQPAGWALMQRLNDEVDRRWADKIVIAEQLPDDAGITTPTALVGAGFDAQYHDRYTDDLRLETFNAVAGDPAMWKIRNIITGSGAYLNGPSVVNYAELHDEAWPSSGGQRLAKTLDPTAPHDDAQAKGRSKLSQGLTLTAPGIPAFLMGGEWLEDTDFGTTSTERIDWSKKTTYAGIFRFFQDLIALRRNLAPLRADAPVDVFQTNEGANVVAFRRFDTLGNTVVVVANFSNNTYANYRVGMPDASPWEEILNSEAVVYEGTGQTNPGVLFPEAIAFDGFPQSLALNLPARALVLLSNGAGTVAVPDGEGESVPTLGRVFPNPTRGPATVEFGLEHRSSVRVTVYDLRGRRVALLQDGILPAGTHLSRWNGRTESGEHAAAGLYFVRFLAGGKILSRKVVLVP